MLRVLRPGPIATLQGSARSGLRHQGIPASGPADPLSMALANRLVGNALDATAIEITFGGAAFEFLQPAAFAFTGALPGAVLAGAPVSAHETLEARPGDVLEFTHPGAGVRTYLAIAGGIRAVAIFGSTSTFLPAALGGLSGRALAAGDMLEVAGEGSRPPPASTPAELRPHMAHTHTLRAVPGPDYENGETAIWSGAFRATNRMDRTGMEVSGDWPAQAHAPTRPSAALFTGAVQLTPSGNAFILLPDAQTTGGYPHILQVARADRHLLGQVAPGDRIRFLKRSVDEARSDLVAKADYFSGWLPGFRF